MTEAATALGDFTMEDLREADEALTAYFSSSEFSKQFWEFVKRGGTILVLPPEPANPKRFEYARINKVEKAGQLSQYAQVRVPKGESLANRLNMASQDFRNVGGSTRSDRITSEQIHGALANRGFTEMQENLVLYVRTGEARYRSSAWAEMLCTLADIILEEDGSREPRKRGVMDACARLAAEYLRNPNNYRAMSDRMWAERLGLDSHRNWPRRWRPRFNKLVEHGEDLIDRAQAIIARNF